MSNMKPTTRSERLPVLDALRGFALMRKVPFSYLPLFALGILTAQWIFSRIWLARYKQGPLEYIWRRLSYKEIKSK